MKTLRHVTCAGCGLDGPGGEMAAQAVLEATAQGWLTGQRPRSRTDYCPACRDLHEPKMCAVLHKGRQSQAVYRQDAPGRDSLYTCGIHAQQLMRELFNSGASYVRTIPLERNGNPS